MDEKKKPKFRLELTKDIPTEPSYNDLVLWCLTRKQITVSQEDFSKLPETVRPFFKEV